MFYFLRCVPHFTILVIYKSNTIITILVIYKSNSHINSLIFILCPMNGVHPSVTVANYCNQMEKLENLYLKLSNSNSQFIIKGDFNYINHLKIIVLFLSMYRGKKAHSFVNLSWMCNMYQFNYIINGNLLFLVFSDKVNIDNFTASGLSKLDLHNTSLEIKLNLNK